MINVQLVDGVKLNFEFRDTCTAYSNDDDNNDDFLLSK